jgi:hypothetical protein
MATITKQLVDLFIADIEKKLETTLQVWGYKNLDEFVENITARQQTVEKTKLLSHFYEKSFKTICKTFFQKIEESSSDGFDIIIDDKKYEMKMTLSSGDSWTGNSCSQVKVNDLILIKLNFNEHNKVDKIFFATLNAQNSSWVAGGKNAGFSTLNIHRDDMEGLDIIYGSVSFKRGASKYLKVNLEDR